MSKIDIARLKIDSDYWLESDPHAGKSAYYCTALNFWLDLDLHPEHTVGDCCIPRPTKQEWAGGVPPVGTDCEYLPDPKIETDWRRCTFIAHVNGEFFVVTDSDTKNVDRMCDLIPASRRFRPLKSPHERQREELISVIERNRAFTACLTADAILARFNLEEK